MARTRYRVGDENYPHFVTCTAVGWLPAFTRPECVAIVFDSWKYLQRESGLRILGYVVMENRLHLVARTVGLAEQIARFKSYTARQIIDRLNSLGDRTLLDQLRWHKSRHKADREFQFWQEGSHPEEMRTEPMLRQKLAYVHDNPVRRGYVQDPTHWMYSSARNYAKLSAFVEIETDW